MVNQIIDKKTVAIAGPTGDVTPAALQAVEDARAEAGLAAAQVTLASGEADRAEDARDQAEVFAAGTVELQDEAIAQAVSMTGSATKTALDSTYALKGDIPSSVVTSLQVSRIVAVKEGEPTPPINDGDMLVRYAVPGHVYYKDFASDPAGGAAPVGMTKLLELPATVRAYEGGTGGHVLQVDEGGATAYSLDAADLAEYYEDAEILVRWQVPSQHGVSVFFNVDPVADSYDRITYNTVSEGGRVRWTARRAGVNAYTQEANTILATAGSWYFLRARYANGFIRGKVWADGSSEPSEWAYSREVETMIPPLPEGKHAVGGVNVFHRIDYLVHATGGKVAVKP